jgi:CheY-like chemotaxis protein
MQPSTVTSGAEALHALQERRRLGSPYPLVVLDALMPEMDGFTLAERIRNDPQLASTIMVMLSSASQPDHAERARQCGVARYATKPVRQSELLAVITSVLGDMPVPAGRARTGSGAGLTAAAAQVSERPLRILLAEDNEVNQKLAVRWLNKWGHTVTVAGSGREALARLDGEAFDLVLMDVQMPDMGGLEATSVIRTREKDRGTHVPILAMTAHALKGDRERCLAAGMDGYITKPIRPAEMFRTIEDLELPAPVSRALPADDTFDRKEVLYRFDNDFELLSEAVQAFLEECPQRMTGIGSALAAGDAEAVERLAHALKGSAGNFAARQVVEAAQQLESVGRNGEMAAGLDAYTRLEHALARLQPALVTLIRSA